MPASWLRRRRGRLGVSVAAEGRCASAVGVGKCVRRLGWARGRFAGGWPASERKLVQCVSVDSGSTTVPVSPQRSLAREGCSLHGYRGMLPVSTNVRLLFHPVLPETNTPTTEPRGCDVCSGLIWRNGDGGSAFAVRGHRHLEEGCEGLCPHPGARPDAHAGDNVYRQDARSEPGFPWCTGSRVRWPTDKCPTPTAVPLRLMVTGIPCRIVVAA
jgi:hypothetical protein